MRKYRQTYYSRFSLLIGTLALLLFLVFIKVAIKRYTNSFREKDGTDAIRDAFVILLLMVPNISGKAMEFLDAMISTAFHT